MDRFLNGDWDYKTKKNTEEKRKQKGNEVFLFLRIIFLNVRSLLVISFVSN